MSITDELREYTEEQIKWMDMTKVHYRKLFAIADRIDAEHEEALLNVHTDLMDARGWVRWPKDADGEPLDEADFVEVIGEDYVTSIEWFALKGMEWYARLSAHTEFCADGSVDKIWMSDYVKVSELRRDKPTPTVEDVLREFADKYAFYKEVSIHPDLKAHEEVLRQYAAKLREMLAGDAE